MSRKIWLSALTLLVAVCIGLSVIALAGALVVVLTNGAAPLQATPTPQGSAFLFNF